MCKFYKTIVILITLHLVVNPLYSQEKHKKRQILTNLPATNTDPIRQAFGHPSLPSCIFLVLLKTRCYIGSKTARRIPRNPYALLHNYSITHISTEFRKMASLT
jgi:hypothetical protein